METNNITIKEYLTQKNIPFREEGKELITKCLFNDCDRDSSSNEAHLYFNKESGQYDCKKCGKKGNLITLKKHFGDSSYPYTSYRNPRFSDGLVQKCHDELPARIKTYLNNKIPSQCLIHSKKYSSGMWNRLMKKPTVNS